MPCYNDNHCDSLIPKVDAAYVRQLAMTVTSARYLEPVSDSDAKIIKKSPKRPLQVWHAVEPPFKGYETASSEGYRKSSGDTAIVIDNGMDCRLVAFDTNPLTVGKVLVLYEPAGLSMQPHDYHSPPTWRDTEIASSTGLFPTWAMMLMPMPLRGVRSGMLLSRGPVLWVIGT